MKVVYRVIVLIFLLLDLLFSQEKVGGHGLFQLDFDYARFAGDEMRSYVEMYYGIRESILTYKREGDKYKGLAKIRIVISNNSDIISEKEISIPHIIADTLQLLKSQTLVNIEGFGLPFGEYNVSVEAFDENNAQRRDSILFHLSLMNYVKERESLSDIELCSTIQSSDNKKSRYYKNTLEVVPNPSRIYGAGLYIMYYYLEMYNLKFNDDKNKLTIRTSLIDAMGKEIVISEKNKPRLLNSSVEVGAVNLSSYKGGTYLFRISLVDSLGAVITSKEKKFFIYKPYLKEEVQEFVYNNVYEDSEFANMAEAELDQEMLYAKYIASDAEIIKYQKLSDVKAKRKFICEFWRKRDTDLTTMENEYRIEYKNRIIIANQNYSFGRWEGWKTDRGRIYITYGPPTEIDRFPNTLETNPYEIWHYNNIQNGVIFVFVDRTGSGEFILVHSNYYTEIRDDDWYNAYAIKIH